MQDNKSKKNDVNIIGSTNTQITDKELLTFCNLMNLKMEYANLQYEKEKGEVKELVNHTIYSLLDNEYSGIDMRETLEYNKIAKQRI